MIEAPPQSESPPERLTRENVVYWSTTFKELKGLGENAICTKAHKFVKLGLVKYDREAKCFWVNHIEGYNKTNYKVFSIKGTFNCNCQFHCKTEKMCSHILAVLLYLKMQNWNKKPIDEDEEDERLQTHLEELRGIREERNDEKN